MATSSKSSSTSTRYLLPLGTNLLKGSTGPEVKVLQKALGIKQDGWFGPFTKEAVKRWQYLNGIEVTGVLSDDMVRLLK